MPSTTMPRLKPNERPPTRTLRALFIPSPVYLSFSAQVRDVRVRA
jgi:hypothetical protein